MNLDLKNKKNLVLIALFLSLVHLVLVWPNPTSSIAVTDENAYLGSAYNLAENGSLSITNNDPLQFVGHMWVKVNSSYTPKYPPGSIYIYGLAYYLFGDSGVKWVNPVASCVCVFLLFFLMLNFLNFYNKEDSNLNIILSIITISAFLFYQPITVLAGTYLTHSISLLIITFGYLVYFRKRFSKSILDGVWVGLIFGSSVVVHYSNIVLIIPFFLLFIFDLLRERKFNRFLFGLGCGSYLFLFGLQLYNINKFDGPLITGYSFFSEQTAFRFSSAEYNFNSLVSKLYSSGFWVLAPFSIFGVWRLFKSSKRDAFIFCSWILIPFVLITLYYAAPKINSPRQFSLHIRSIMTILPLLFMLGFFGISKIKISLNKKLLISIACLFVLIPLNYKSGKIEIDAHRRLENDNIKISTEIDSHFKDGDVIFAPVKNLLNLLIKGKYILYNRYLIDFDTKRGGAYRVWLEFQESLIANNNEILVQPDVAMIKMEILEPLKTESQLKNYWINIFENYLEKGKSIGVVMNNESLDRVKYLFAPDFQVTSLSKLKIPNESLNRNDINVEIVKITKVN